MPNYELETVEELKEALIDNCNSIEHDTLTVKEVLSLIDVTKELSYNEGYNDKLISRLKGY